MQTFTSVDYTPGLDIRNVEMLPKGSGCRFLLCVFGPTEETLIAKSWHRKYPSRRKTGEVVVMFDQGATR